MIGQTIAHYTITAKIGAGGMGEVFRARDEKLNRDVALKILPEAYATDAQRMGRFQREARLLASLNHANIASIYGLEESGATRALVLELVEGDDLSAMLRARKISSGDALEIAVQIADALEFAHESGVIHRDLKPANVKVTPEGKVKVLDFGLAKAFMDESASAPEAGDAMSPTLSIAASTAGVILGTAAYMSPEQARGKPADRRSDIWSFGIVLFEMLTGRQLFSGETVSDTLAAVIKDEPDWNLLPAETPHFAMELIRRCLEKDPRKRLQSIGEARIALEKALQGDGDAAASASLISGPRVDSLPGQDSPAPDSPGRSRPVLWLLALLFVAAGAGYVGTRLVEPPLAGHSRKFVLLPDGLSVAYPSQPALSPNGRYVAYFSEAGLNIQDLTGLESVEIPNSVSATAPFWSPDSEWLAFGQNNRLFRVAAAGGTPSAICDAPFGVLDGGAWGDDDMLYLAPNSGPIYTVPAQGGDPRPVFTADADETDFHTPSVLPGGRGILFTTHNTEGRETIELFDGESRHVILRIPGARLEYAMWSALPGSDSRGHLVYHRLSTNTGVWAVPFDLDGSRVTGEPFIVDPEGAFPSVAIDGSLLYAQGFGGGPLQLVLVDIEGNVVQRVGQPQIGMSWPELSPDGRSILVSAVESENRDVWLHDIERGSRTRMSFAAESDFRGSWANGGRDVLINEATGGSNITYIRPADSSRERERLVEGYHVSMPDGVEWFAYNTYRPDTGFDIMYMAREEGAEAQPFLITPAAVLGPELSPDGRHIAYMSNESGSNEVYIKSFPTGEGKWQVSTQGGAWPKWSRDGRSIVYREGAGGSAVLTRVAVEFDPQLRLGTPKALVRASENPQLMLMTGQASYNVTSDPNVFIMLEKAGDRQEAVSRLVFTEDWYASHLQSRGHAD